VFLTEFTSPYSPRLKLWTSYSVHLQDLHRFTFIFVTETFNPTVSNVK